MLQQVGVITHRELLELEQRLVDNSSETHVVLHHVGCLVVRTSEKMVVAHHQSSDLLSARADVRYLMLEYSSQYAAVRSSLFQAEYYLIQSSYQALSLAAERYIVDHLKVPVPYYWNGWDGLAH
jgi:hypothetical protein